MPIGLEYDRAWRIPTTLRSTSEPSGSVNDPAFDSIAERLRQVLRALSRICGTAPVAEQLGLSDEAVNTFLNAGASELDAPELVVDAIAALVHVHGFNAEFLLTGVYSVEEHQFVEEKLRGRPELREYVKQRVRRLRNGGDAGRY